MTYRIREKATGHLLATRYATPAGAGATMMALFPRTHPDYEIVEDEPYFAPENFCPICGGSYTEPDPHTPGTCTCTPDELRRLDP